MTNFGFRVFLKISGLKESGPITPIQKIPLLKFFIYYKVSISIDNTRQNNMYLKAKNLRAYLLRPVILPITGVLSNDTFVGVKQVQKTA